MHARDSVELPSTEAEYPPVNEPGTLPPPPMPLPVLLPPAPATNGHSAGTPPPPAQAESNGSGWDDDRIIITSAPRRRASYSQVTPSMMAAEFRPYLAATMVWLTPNGTLTRTALRRLMEACGADLGPDCRAAAMAGAPLFRRVPESARREFAFLLAKCDEVESDDCPTALMRERDFRDLRRGRLLPSPLRMVEDERVLFTAKLLYDGFRPEYSTPGDEIGSARPSPSQPGGALQILVPFTPEMCFRLESHPDDFRIERIGAPCQKLVRGSIPFAPRWWVTPLRPGRLDLELVTEHLIEGAKREFRHEPYPLPIEVAAAPSWWDRLDAALIRATKTVGLGVGLAEAIGALLAAIAAWAIWGWIRRGRRHQPGAQPTPSPGASPAATP